MANTFSSNRVLVSDGETTSHDTSKDAPINILSAEARWVGTTETSDGTLTYETANRDSSIFLSEGESETHSHPPRPDNTTYDHSELILTLFEESTTLEITGPDGNTLGSISTSSGEFRKTKTFTYTDSDLDGGDITVTATSVPSGESAIYDVNELRTYGSVSARVNDRGATTTIENTDSVSVNSSTTVTLSATVPSVNSPDRLYHAAALTFSVDNDEYTANFTIDRDDDGTVEVAGHGVNVDVASSPAYGGINSFTRTATFPIGSAGTTISATIDVSSATSVDGSITLSAQTVYADGSINPSVSGDVSASYSGELVDNDPSGWQPLSGLAANQSNTFDHSISGSGYAFFEFRYDWEYQTPAVLYLARVHENGTTYDLPLVNPQDSLLAYSNTRTVVEGTIVAADLVDVDNANASPVRVHIPNHGTKAWRENV